MITPLFYRPRVTVASYMGRMEYCDPQEMIALARAGDTAALDKVTRCYGERLLAVGRRHCRTEEDARDAVQDALLSANLHLATFRGDGSLEGWLIRMVARACGRMRRGRKNDPGLHVYDEEVADDNGSPELDAARAKLAEMLGAALLDLSPQDRVIVLLAEAEDWTGPQIAEKLGMSAGAVRVRLTRARQKLRARLASAVA